MGNVTPGRAASSDDDADRVGPADSRAPGERRRDSWAAPGSSDVVEVPTSDPADDPAGDPAADESADQAGPGTGRRLLARIPGLSQLAEQSGWVGGGSEPSPGEDPGWVFHEAGDSEAFEGWLYHYADGTMVDADGGEYAVSAPPGATSGAATA